MLFRRVAERPLMTDFMTALPVILVQPTCPGDQRAKGVQFQSTCNLCRESHKTQVWLCFLVLSLLSTATCAAPLTEPMHICLTPLKSAIEKSDAMLYAPSANNVSNEIWANCKMMSLRCYMLELIMVINEEEIEDKKVKCIHSFNAGLPKDNSAGCPPCEAYPLENSRIFLERLRRLLQEMNVQQNALKT